MAVSGPRRGERRASALRSATPRWLVLAALAAALVSACGGAPSRTAGSPSPGGRSTAGTPSPADPATASSPAAAASAGATPGPHLDTAYCGTADSTIPGAAAVIDHDANLANPITPVQRVWFDMWSTMVPACSEITPDPPPVQSRNLTGGALSGAAFQTWIREDEEFWTLFEWGQRHGQAAFLQYLLDDGSNGAVSFVLDGGRIVDTPACEYLEQVDAVHVTSVEMQALTSGTRSSSGDVFVGASVGPCTSTWTASDGALTLHTLAAGQAADEVDVTVTSQNPALGQYLRYQASWVRGTSQTADDVMAQVGIPGG